MALTSGRYSEAIEFLYSSTCFVIASDDTYLLIPVSHLLLPARLSQIRSFRLEWDISDFTSTCFDFVFLGHGELWEALGRLTGLRRLEIELHKEYCYNHQVWVDRQSAFLEPVKTITAPSVFVITLPDPRCSAEMDRGETNCVLRLPGLDCL